MSWRISVAFALSNFIKNHWIIQWASKKLFTFDHSIGSNCQSNHCRDLPWKIRDGLWSLRFISRLVFFFFDIVLNLSSGFRKRLDGHWVNPISKPIPDYKICSAFLANQNLRSRKAPNPPNRMWFGVVLKTFQTLKSISRLVIHKWSLWWTRKNFPRHAEVPMTLVFIRTILINSRH